MSLIYNISNVTNKLDKKAIENEIEDLRQIEENATTTSATITLPYDTKSKSIVSIYIHSYIKFDVPAVLSGQDYFCFTSSRSIVASFSFS